MKKLIILIYCITICAACSDDTSDSGTAKDRYATLGNIANDTWTYISLATGKVVGTAPFGTASEDSVWATRTDWDLALCGTYMRTNGGTSGGGNGGVIKVQGTSYESIADTTSQTFITDSIYTIQDK